jgi:glutamate carboxypeptidase
MSSRSERSVFDGIEQEMLNRLSDLVRLESPSRDKMALDILGGVLAERLRQLGASVEIIRNAHGGDHVLGRFAGSAALRPALVLGHFDTVWPRGTLERMPFRVGEDGRAFGPGILDMKASLVVFLAVMEHIEKDRPSTPRPPRPIWVLFTSDEELGSPTSRSLIEKLALECAYALVLEPALADGALKSSRKGVGKFRLDVEGRPAHAGVAPQDGRSAIVELAHQVLKLEALQDQRAGTTVTVGVIQGGTTANVVPARATAEIDVRVASKPEEIRIDQALRSLGPVTPDVRLSVSGSWNRPPMERTPAGVSFFEQARQVARRHLGIDLAEGPSGGGSDGNFTAALGVPTLDGLGARGGGAHADDEHIFVASLSERAALLYALLLGLQVET